MLKPIPFPSAFAMPIHAGLVVTEIPPTESGVTGGVIVVDTDGVAHLPRSARLVTLLLVEERKKAVFDAYAYLRSTHVH